GAALFGGMAAFPAWVLASNAIGRGYAGVAGAQGRLTKWGTFTAALTWSHYPDSDLGQLDANALLPVTPHFALGVGARAQLASDGLHGAGRLEARLHGARWLVAASAQLGSEWRPYDVDTRAIYNLNQLLRYGTELRGWAPLASWLDGFASL